MAFDTKELTFSPCMATSRNEEKAALGSLNHRFTNYIDKMKSLTERNLWLEDRINEFEDVDSLTADHGIEKLEKSHTLQKQLQCARLERTSAILELERLQKELEHCQKRLDREADDRKDAEMKSNLLRKDVDHATLTRIKLEGKVELLKEELDLCKNHKKEELQLLQEHLQAAQKPDDNTDQFCAKPVLSDTLRNVRTEFEKMMTKNSNNRRKQYHTQIAILSANAKAERLANENNKSNILETRKKIQDAIAKHGELQSRNIALKLQFQTTNSRYQHEINQYQTTIKSLQKKLDAAKCKAERQMRAHSKLLNVKLTLENELATYRKLLDCEEVRIPNFKQPDSNHLIQEDSDAEERDYQMRKHYYSLYPLEMHAVERDRSVASSSSDEDSIEEPSLDESDLHESLALKESVGSRKPILEDCRESCRSETWSVEAVEVDLFADDVIHKNEEVFYLETLS